MQCNAMGMLAKEHAPSGSIYAGIKGGANISSIAQSSPRSPTKGSPSVDGKTISKTRSPVSGVAEAVAPSAEGMAENAWRDQSKSGTGVEKGVSSSPRGDGTKSGAPESAKAPESPAPSPKVLAYLRGAFLAR